MKSHITIITLGVDDLQRSIDFTKRLGLPRKDESDSIAFFEMSGTMLALYPRDALAEDITISPEGTGFQGFTLAHNVDSPEEVDRTLAEALPQVLNWLNRAECFLGWLFGLFQGP